jgi:hypothetical protein
MQKEGKKSVLMLVRDRFYLSDGSSVLQLEFHPSVVHDLDLKDKDALFNLVVNFIQENKLTPSQLYFVLGESVCFTKDFTVNSTTDNAAEEAMVSEYIDTIPFSSVISKVYKTATTWRVVGANQDLINTIFEAFANRGFGLSALVPANILPDLSMSAELTPVKAQTVLSKKESVIAVNSMVGQRVAENQQLTTTKTAVPKNKLLPYLAVGFVVLLIILVVLLLKR